MSAVFARRKTPFRVPSMACGAAGDDRVRPHGQGRRVRPVLQLGRARSSVTPSATSAATEARRRLGGDVRRIQPGQCGVLRGDVLRRGLAAAIGRRVPDGSRRGSAVPARRPRQGGHHAAARPAPRVQERSQRVHPSGVHRSPSGGDGAPRRVGDGSAVPASPRTAPSATTSGADRQGAAVRPRPSTPGWWTGSATAMTSTTRCERVGTDAVQLYVGRYARRGWAAAAVSPVLGTRWPWST